MRRQGARVLLERAGVQADVVVGVTGGALLARLADAVKPHATVGFEATHVSFQQHADWAAAFSSTLKPAAGIVEAERRAGSRAA